MCQCNGKKEKVYTLGIIDSQNAEPYYSARISMLDFLKSKGYVEKKNLKIIYFTIGNSKKKGLLALDKVVAKKPDVIFVNGTMATLSVKDSSYFNNPKHKFVFTCVTDPVGVGVIDDFGVENPYNITGVSYPVPVVTRLRFVMSIMPKLKKIGLVYADMPQSHSYKKWVEKALKEENDLKHLKVFFQKVHFIEGEEGTKKMAERAKKYILEMDKKVDVFLSPNDQMGVQKPFAKVVFENSTKPLIGLGLKDIMEKWGPTAVIYPSYKSMGVQSAQMIIKLFKGVNVKSIPAQWPKEHGFAFDLKKAKTFNLKISKRYLELAGENIVR